MHMVLSLMLMQECCHPGTRQFICQWENVPGGVYKNKALITLRFDEIFHLPLAREISRHISC